VQRLVIGLGCIGLLCLVTTVWVWPVLGHPPLSNKVYTVADVSNGLRQHPQTWTGRTITVQGDIMMWGNIQPCAGTCAPITLLNLVPVHTPRWSDAQARVADALASSCESRSQLSPSSPFVPKLGPNLLLQIPAGRSIPVAKPRHVLPDAVFHLPIAGPALARLFPQVNSSLLVHVRISSLRAWFTQRQSFCADGVVLNS